MAECSDESHTTDHVAEKSRQEELAEISCESHAVRYHHVEHRGRACHNVIETSKADNVRENDDDAHACRLGTRQ